MAERDTASRRGRTARRTVLALCAVLAAAAAVLALRRPPGDLYRPDPNAAPASGRQDMSLAEMQDQLQSQADESAFRLRINTRPTVVDGQADLLLENPVENGMDLRVTITLDADGQVVYVSPDLVPGAQVLQGELMVKLPPGEHPATAQFTALDPGTGEAVSTPGGVELILTAEAPPGIQEP